MIFSHAAQTSYRPVGIALILIVVVFMIGASVAAYFRQFPIPEDPVEQLTLIANDRAGWTAQAIIFPLSFLAISICFGWLTMQLHGAWPRRLAVLAALFSLAALLFWVPISLNRLCLGRQAADLLETYQPGTALPVTVNFDSFWLYTFCALVGIGLMGAALALASVLPALGWVIAALSLTALFVGRFVWGDWPPFMSYILLLVLAVGLVRTG